MGALDVCPFIPVRGVSMEDCVLCAKAFGQQLAEELNVPGECLGRIDSGAPLDSSLPMHALCAGHLLRMQIMSSMVVHTHL